ncbi:MAG: tetratricopeptide repeat protein [Kiritimatiellae bacterium]|nr:tetratricopeptide repeat protein [Kiritimatiellia bacterium]
MYRRILELSPDRRRVGALAASLALIVGALFAPALRFDFAYYDDDVQVLENPLVRSLGPRALLRTFTGLSVRSYYPVRVLSFALDYKLSGVKPAGYHRTNVLIHLLNVLLLFALVRRVCRETAPAGRGTEQAPDVLAAFLAACLFGVHPVVVEPVAWVAGREELLTVLFGLACLHFHLSALACGGREAPCRVPGWAHHALSVACCALACMSNAVGAVVPGLVFAHDLGFRPPRRRGRVAVYIVLGLMAAGTTALKLWSNAAAVAAVREPPGPHMLLSAGERFLTVLNTYRLNVATLVWPHTLIVPYPATVPDRAWESGVLLGAALAAGTLAALWLARRRRVVWVGLVWFVVGLAPAAQLLPHHVFRADRFLYLPLAGVALALAGMLRPLGARRTWRAVALCACGAACAALGVRSVFQLQYWSDPITLFGHTLTVDAANPIALNNRGVALSRAGRYEAAASHFAKAIALSGRNAEAYNNLGLAFLRQGRLDDAMRQFPKALAIDPAYVDAHHNLAFTLAKQGRHELAQEHYSAALRLNPGYSEAHYNLGRLRADEGKLDEAIGFFSAAIRANPDYGVAHYNLANALVAKGDVQAAIRHYSEAVRLNADDAEAHHNLALVLQRRGQPQAAIGHFSEALRVNAHDALTHYGLAGALSACGRTAEAEAHYRRALRLNPDYKEAHYNLGRLLAGRGQEEAAVAQYSRAIELDPRYAKAHNNLGALFAQQQRFDLAVAHFSQALGIAPGNAGTHFNLGRALAARGQRQEALAHFSDALRIRPDFEQARTALDALGQ